MVIQQITVLPYGEVNIIIYIMMGTAIPRVS